MLVVNYVEMVLRAHTSCFLAKKGDVAQKEDAEGVKGAEGAEGEQKEKMLVRCQELLRC